MTEEIKNAMQELQKKAVEADERLAEIAKKAIEAEDLKLQMATISMPFSGIQTLRVYMQESENPKNFVYSMRIAVSSDPTRGDCILSILAELALEFKDEKMKELIKENPSAGPKTKGVLGV